MAFFRYFVILRGVFSLFRLFAWRFSLFRYFALRYFVISSFRVALFRYFVFLRGVISLQKDEKTKWHKSATISMACRSEKRFLIVTGMIKRTFIFVKLFESTLNQIKKFFFYSIMG